MSDKHAPPLSGGEEITKLVEPVKLGRGQGMVIMGPDGVYWPWPLDEHSQKYWATISKAHRVELERLRAALSPPPQDGEREKALRDIASERQRQIEQEGWTTAHDDAHPPGALAQAAVSYAIAGSYSDYARRHYLGEWHSGRHSDVRRWWPWDWKWWKPKDRRRDLVRAGALIVAEIERLDRFASGQGGKT